MAMGGSKTALSYSETPPCWTMAELNNNHDSVINNSDINFSSLKVWTDINSNGVTNDSELHTLADLGTVSFDFNATATSTRDHGNTVGMVSSYYVGVGGERQSYRIADICFSADARSSFDGGCNDHVEKRWRRQCGRHRPANALGTAQVRRHRQPGGPPNQYRSRRSRHVRKQVAGRQRFCAGH